jgi:restriction system protein
MGRRSGFEGFLRAAARGAAAAERERQRNIRMQTTQMRQLERHVRMAEAQRTREYKAMEKLEKALYLEDRQSEVDDLNSELVDRIETLRVLLAHTLMLDDTIQFDDLRHTTGFKSFDHPRELHPTAPPIPPSVPAPTGMSRLIPGAGRRHSEAVAEATRAHQQAMDVFQQQEARKRKRIAELKAEHDREKTMHDAELERRNADVDEFQANYLAKDPDAIIAYNEMVLARSEYPTEGFPQNFKVGYGTESAELIVEYDLPEMSVIPKEVEYRYVKSKDLIESKPRKAAEIKQLYQDIVASIALRTLHEVFEADQADALSVCTFNGMIDTHDPASGRPLRVPVVSVRTPKASFLELHLDRIEKIACLRSLGAQVSSRPDELQAIKPIIEFNMVDKRFIEQDDVLGGLESRPNLLELTPAGFEALVSNLFTKMGLDTKLTRSSRDGGVDAVAFDTRPILGGKVVIQAKRYKDTVGVSAVRDLYGTMMNEGANKGILVCTSGYGPDAYNFTKDKPIELIDGGGLLYLLREHAGIDARIAA